MVARPWAMSRLIRHQIIIALKNHDSGNDHRDGDEEEDQSTRDPVAAPVGAVGVGVGHVLTPRSRPAMEMQPWSPTF